MTGHGAVDPARDRLVAALAATHSIDRELPGGGMARVFVATERSLGRPVVVKTLPDEAWTPAAAARFRQEIQVAARLQHANIVPVLGAGDADGVPYFTMPLVEGATLRDRLSRGPVPLPEAVAILRDVARALAAAHAAGVVHRDIKPENVLLSRGAALVSDFGVAKARSMATGDGSASTTLTAAGMALGTPAYMAPEQIAADPELDHRADLYAWGVMAYELLAGARPFAGLSGGELLRAQLATMPPPLSGIVPAVPPALADVIMQCLAKDASARPASADAVLAVLDAPLASGPTAVPAGGRRTVRVAAVAAVAVVALGGAWWLARARSSPADAGTIAVAPFRVGGAAPEARYLREGLGDLIVPQLQALPGHAATGMRVLLDRWRRAAGSPDDDLGEAEARAVAGAAGAAQLVLGEIVGTRDRLTVTARLLRVQDGAPLAEARVDGSADSAFALATRLVTSLLAPSDGATRERLRTVLSATPEAIAPYLQGEQLYRRGRYVAAHDAFARAWGADSTFALAALRANQAQVWVTNLVQDQPWLERAWQHRDRLTGVDSLVLTGTLGVRYPAPTPRSVRLRTLREHAERGGSTELWYSYADFLFHDGATLEIAQVDSLALDGFRRAEALDSSFAGALEHQALLYLAKGDTSSARRALARQAALDSTGDFFRVNDAMVETALGGARGRDRALDRLEARDPAQLVFAAGVMFAGYGAVPPRPDFSDSALARARRRDRRVTEAARDVTRGLGWNTGRPSLVVGTPAAPDDALGLAFDVLTAVFEEDTYRSLATRAATRLDAMQELPPAARLVRATWALVTGDTAGAIAVRDRLAADARRAPAGTRGATRLTTMAALVDAQLAAAARRPDAAARVALADSLLLDAPLQRVEERQVGNLLVAGLWESLGDTRRALRALDRRDGEIGFTLFHADRLRRTARLARTLGLRDREQAALQHFVALRADAEPAQRAEVEAARRRLEQLAPR